MTSNSDASPQALAANSNAANAADTPAGKGVKLTEKIDFSGNALVNNQPEALTGQQITATLSGQPKHSIITGYTWSFSGATSPNPIKTWDGTAPNTVNSTQLVQLAPTDLSGTDASGSGIPVQPIQFYDLVADNVTAICDVTLKITDAKGNVTTRTDHVISENTINFLKPTATWGIDPQTMLVDGQPANNIIGFHDDSANSASYGINTTWYPAKITVPFPFVGGMGCFAQIVTPAATMTRIATGTGASTYSIQIESPPGSGNWVAPSTGLDKNFPYNYGLVVDSSGNIVNIVTNSYTWQITNTGASGDNPQGQEIIDDLDDGGTNWQTSNISDSFITYLMYQPPAAAGHGTIWVPIMKASWSASGQASKGSNTWSATGTYIPPVPSNTSDIPQWTHVIKNQQYRPIKSQ